MNSTVHPGSASNASQFAPQFAPVIRLRDWIDARGRPAWIAAMVLGFVAFWPVGLGILGYMLWTKRFACGRDRSGTSFRGCGPSSGNSAFDAYRAETLKRLEDEQRDFHDFLRHLREAKDKAEFDAFMQERQTRSSDMVVEAK